MNLIFLTLTTFRCRSWTKRILITNRCMIRWIGFLLMKSKVYNSEKNVDKVCSPLTKKLNEYGKKIKDYKRNQSR